MLLKNFSLSSQNLYTASKRQQCTETSVPGSRKTEKSVRKRRHHCLFVKDKHWTDFIMKQNHTSNQTCTSNCPQILFPSRKIGTLSGAYYYFYTNQKEKSKTLLPWRKFFLTSIQHISFQNSYFFKNKMSTQNVSTYRKRSKKFYKLATHLNVPPAWVSFGFPLCVINWLRKLWGDRNGEITCAIWLLAPRE